MDIPKHKVLLVGLGVMGRHHLRLLRGNPAVEVVGVVDPLLPVDLGIPTFGSLADVPTGFGEIAWISTPAQTHNALIREALERGMSVFVEKPFTTDPQHALELMQIAESRKALLFVGHSERYHPAFRTLVKQIQALGVKAIQRIECVRKGHIPVRGMDCGVAHEVAVHDLDCVLALLGNVVPERWSSRVERIPGNRYEDALEASLSFPHGITVSLHVSRMDSQKERRITVFTDHGSITADFLTPFPNAAEEPLLLEHQEFFRILAQRDDTLAAARLESARLAVEVATKLVASL